MATLVDDLVPDQLWALVEPLLPARELGRGSPSTRWGRLTEAAQPGSGGPRGQGYDNAANRVWLRRRGIRPQFAFVLVACALICSHRLEGQAEVAGCAGGRRPGGRAGFQGRSHSDVVVGCIV
jgi:hypothetical protein